ncbi:hypothetical protein ACIP6V_30785 [Streptomyces sp. NPDC088770]|uniref:hypothetical protein n=1 Tax=Streptomyces sp. NPDC088770 TaxID=3365895 RepID=UPI0038021C85
MGSLRNPVGPLPASIYWRRRVIMLSVVALLALLIAWIAPLGGGGRKTNGGGPNDKHPGPSASTITPGPSGSGPAISQHPGGRDESGSGDSDGSGSGSGGTGDTGGSDSSGGSGDGGGAGSGGSGGGSGGGGDEGGASGGGPGAVLPAGSSLPKCTSGAVKLTLRSVRNSYGPGQTPEFELVAANSSGGDCKVDLGPKSAVVTISQAESSSAYWSSADCPKTAGSRLYRVSAGSGFTYTVRWDRKPSAPQCATPPAGSARAGTYLVEAKVPGYAKLRTSFVLSED